LYAKENLCFLFEQVSQKYTNNRLTNIIETQQ